MKPRILVLLLVALLCPFISGQPLSNPYYSSSDFSKRMPLKVVTESLPPFQIVDRGHVVGGMSTEIVHALLAQTGDQAIIRSHNWARAYKIAQEQENVLIFSLARNAHRENQFKWVGLIYHLDNYFWKLANRDDVHMTTLNDAKLYRTAVARENIEHQLLLDNGFVEPNHLVVTSSVNHALGMLLRGRSDLYVGSKPLINNMLRGTKYRYSDLSPIYQLENEGVKLYVAFSLKTQDKRVEAYRRAYERLLNDGTYDRIVSKWESMGNWYQP